MRYILPAVAVAAATALPSSAQNEIGENPVLEQGSVTCGEYLVMDWASRINALGAVEPVGGDLADSDPAVVRQWAGEVASACEGHSGMTIQDAARTALGGD